MAQLLWDASALVKRYIYEAGSDTVDALFERNLDLTMVVTMLGYAEACSVLRRRLNQQSLEPEEFASARELLALEVLDGFTVLSIDDRNVLSGIRLVDHYNLNASDAAILDVLLCQVREQEGERILVASDLRLLRAAAAEGLSTLNPETATPEDLPVLLGQ